MMQSDIRQLSKMEFGSAVRLRSPLFSARTSKLFRVSGREKIKRPRSRNVEIRKWIGRGGGGGGALSRAPLSLSCCLLLALYTYHY